MTNEEIIDKATLAAQNLRTALSHVTYAAKVLDQVEEGVVDLKVVQELYKSDDEYQALVDDIRRYYAEIERIVS